MRSSVEIGRMFNELRAIRGAFTMMHYLYKPADKEPWKVYVRILDMKLQEELRYRVEGLA
jgi:hypothetical protein